MFKILGLDHIVLRVFDLPKMLDFYCDILGCKVENEQPEIGLTQLRAGDNIIDLLSIDRILNKAEQNMEHFCLRVESFNYEAMCEYFHSHNIEIYRYAKRYGSKGYNWSFYLKDPEGNELELTAIE